MAWTSPVATSSEASAFATTEPKCLVTWRSETAVKADPCHHHPGETPPPAPRPIAMERERRIVLLPSLSQRGGAGGTQSGFETALGAYSLRLRRPDHVLDEPLAVVVVQLADVRLPANLHRAGVVLDRAGEDRLE